MSASSINAGAALQQAFEDNLSAGAVQQVNGTAGVPTNGVQQTREAEQADALERARTERPVEDSIAADGENGLTTRSTSVTPQGEALATNGSVTTSQDGRIDVSANIPNGPGGRSFSLNASVDAETNEINVSGQATDRSGNSVPLAQGALPQLFGRGSLVDGNA